MGGSIGGLQTHAEKNEAAIYSAQITLCAQECSSQIWEGDLDH